MKIRRQHVIVGGVVLLGLTFLIIGVMAQRKMPKYYAHSLRNWQEADSVAGYPIQTNAADEDADPEFISGEFSPNLSSMSPLERFQLPVARGFTKAEDGSAAGNGLVLYTGKPEGYPGEVVLLGHRLPDGRIVQTFYAGLRGRGVIVGEIVARGAKLGKIAKGGLIFEVREGVGIDVQREEVAGTLLNVGTSPSRVDEKAFFQKWGTTAELPEALGILRKEQSDPEKVLEIQYGK